MLEITTTKNKELGLWDITATLTLPPITVTRLKKDKNDPNWKFMNDLTSEEIEGIVQEAIKHDQNERSRPELFSD